MKIAIGDSRRNVKYEPPAALPRMPEKDACKLTKKAGKFVRSHLLPRFLTDKALDKTARIQFGQDGRPKLVFTSWYDPELTTRDGEDRLAEIDTKAAKLFRDLGLSWRHFPIPPAAERHAIGELARDDYHVGGRHKDAPTLLP